jgi:hypothetical protein
MELYINNGWTERYANAHIAQALAWSDNGNHATIYAVGPTAEEADTKLVGALGELKLMPETSKRPKDRRCEWGPRPRHATLTLRRGASIEDNERPTGGHPNTKEVTR